MNKRYALIFAATVISPLLAREAHAQTDGGAITKYVTDEKAPDVPSDDLNGWKASLTLGGSFNLAHNRFVVGQVDGLALLFGANALANTTYRQDKHEWVLNVSLAETWAKTPVVDEFVKSNDVLDVESLYNYYLADWTGAFARLGLQTAIFPTERVTADPEQYARDGDTADPPTIVEETDRFELADPFQPFTLNESLGWFVQPVESEKLTLYARAGVGGRHTFAEGARVIKSDDTGVVRFVDLEDVHQAGAELFAGLDGTAQGGRLQYGAGLSVLFPLLNNDDTDRSVLDLTRVGAQGSLGVSVFTWMSLNYLLKITRDPQLVDEVQVQNSLLLTASFGFSTEDPPEEEPEVDPAVAELEERVAAAEARVAAAEERAAQAEQRAAEAAAASQAPAPTTTPAPEPAPTNP